MAEVYLALSGELSGYRTLVVVKRILPHLATNHDFIRMFLDEARIAALLDHPNVVRIVEVGHDGDEYFLVMELVQGKPLSAIVRKAAKEGAPLTPALAAYIVAQAANGLGYAHNLVDADGRPLGVVHRDVSPQNILVSFEGAVKMIDFGIARALGRVSQTNPGGLKGKIEYMSPEQASSEEVDRRADVFALGVVLWEALTGKHLFRRDTELATMRAIVDEPIPPASDVTPVAPELDAIVTRALQKRKEDRFQTAQEMALALERYAFASEGFSPLQLASYLKQLFDAEFAQWKKTVSSALDLEVKPGAASTGTRFPVIKPDLQTRGPTVALRPGQSIGSDSGFGREPATDLTSSVPSREDRLWVYGGVAATALMVLAGAFVLTRPRPRPSPAPTAPIVAPAPSRWQTMPQPGGAAPADPAAATAIVTPLTPRPAEPAKDETKPLVAPPEPPGAAGEPLAARPKVDSKTDSKPDSKPDRADKARARPRPKRAQGPTVSADHRPNPFGD
jgi:serine/threonine protein kinase